LQIPSWPKIVNKIIQDKSGDGQIILSDIAEELFLEQEIHTKLSEDLFLML